MDPKLQLYLSYSVAIAAVLAVIRFKKISRLYYPFVFLLWIGLINEMVSHWLITHGHYNIVNNNIYSLMEALLILWFLRNTRVFSWSVLFHFLAIVVIIAWLIENFFLSPFASNFNFYFNIIPAIPITLISINVVNDILTRERDILKNPTFIICIAFVIYFTFRILIESFYLSGLNFSEEFTNKVYGIHTWINLVCNLIYAIAVLWMERRQAFTLRF